MSSESQLRGHPDHPAPRKSRIRLFLSELSKRRVCRTAISYMLVMWLNVQIGDVIFPMIGAPDWALNLIVVIGIMGFPVVLILSWAFQVTADGILLDDARGSEHPAAPRTDTLLNLLLLAAAVALSVLMLLQIYSEGKVLNPASTDGEVHAAPVVSRLAISSATDELNSRDIAAGIESELRHRLINHSGIEILPELPQAKLASGSRSIELSGSLLLEDGNAHLLAHLIDLSAGRYLMSITFNLNSDSSLAIELEAADRIFCAVNRTLVDGGTCPDSHEFGINTVEEMRGDQLC